MFPHVTPRLGVIDTYCPVLGSMIAAEPRSRPTVPRVYVSVGEGVAEVVGVGGEVSVGDAVGEGLAVRVTDREVLP